MRMGSTTDCRKLCRKSTITVTCNAGSTKILCLKLAPNSSVVSDGVKR